MMMRMQELAERSGLPRTTIHHYARESLLPPPRKSAKNAAEYDESHLERLALITRLRDESRDPRGLSIPEVRLVLGHLDAGIEPGAAVRLVTEGIDAGPPAAGRWTDAGAFARAAGVSEAFVRTLVEVGLIDDGPDKGFRPGDLLVARACESVCSGSGVDPADLTPLADLIHEVGSYSDTLADVHALRTGKAPTTGSPPGDVRPSQIRPELGKLCDALLWRALEG